MGTNRTFGNMLSDKLSVKKPLNDSAPGEKAIQNPLRPQHIGPKVSKHPGAGLWSKMLKEKK